MSKLLNCISAAELRQRLESREQKTVEDLPGVYRWWFPKAEAEKLLEKFTTPMQKEDRTICAAASAGTSAARSRVQPCVGPCAPSNLPLRMTRIQKMLLTN